MVCRVAVAYASHQKRQCDRHAFQVQKWCSVCSICERRGWNICIEENGTISYWIWRCTAFKFRNEFWSRALFVRVIIRGSWQIGTNKPGLPSPFGRYFFDAPRHDASRVVRIREASSRLSCSPPAVSIVNFIYEQNGRTVLSSSPFQPHPGNSC